LKTLQRSKGTATAEAPHIQKRLAKIGRKRGLIRDKARLKVGAEEANF
jgi:hypothetical protein